MKIGRKSHRVELEIDYVDVTEQSALRYDQYMMGLSLGVVVSLFLILGALTGLDPYIQLTYLAIYLLGILLMYREFGSRTHLASSRFRKKFPLDLAGQSLDVVANKMYYHSLPVTAPVSDCPLSDTEKRFRARVEIEEVKGKKKDLELASNRFRETPITAASVLEAWLQNLTKSKEKVTDGMRSYIVNCAETNFDDVHENVTQLCIVAREFPTGRLGEVEGKFGIIESGQVAVFSSCVVDWLIIGASGDDDVEYVPIMVLVNSEAVMRQFDKRSQASFKDIDLASNEANRAYVDEVVLESERLRRKIDLLTAENTYLKDDREEAVAHALNCYEKTGKIPRFVVKAASTKRRAATAAAGVGGGAGLIIVGMLIMTFLIQMGVG